MFEITILIPVADNHGARFDPEHHATWETFLAETFGGFSCTGETTGGWLDGGRLYRDTTRVYVVAVDGLASAGRAVDAARWACLHYRQEAVFLRYLGQAEVVRGIAVTAEKIAA
jgi:hypothetical protein